mgnify:CR=1 FL=1
MPGRVGLITNSNRCRGRGLQRQRVKLAAHAAAERLVDHLVLLHAALAGKGGGNDAAGIVVAIAAQVFDHHVGVGKSRFDQSFDFGCWHRHETSPGLVLALPSTALISNPPYIKKNNLKCLEKDIGFEPKQALDGGLDGLSEIRKVINKSSELIKRSGHFIIEIGFDQKNKVKKILRDKGFYIKKTVKDLSNHDRCIVSIKT